MILCTSINNAVELKHRKLVNILEINKITVTVQYDAINKAALKLAWAPVSKCKT